jgi:hypothetical protein
LYAPTQTLLPENLSPAMLLTRRAICFYFNFRAGSEEKLRQTGSTTKSPDGKKIPTHDFCLQFPIIFTRRRAASCLKSSYYYSNAFWTANWTTKRPAAVCAKQQ